MVVYDEVERFPRDTDPLFNYPFRERKNIINQFTVLDVSEVNETYSY